MSASTSEPSIGSLRQVLGPAPTVKDVAKYLNAHYATVYRLLYQGQLEVLKKFGRTRISIASLERLLTVEGDYVKTNYKPRKCKTASVEVSSSLERRSERILE
jgi:excisionase family DNA binding protein